MVAVSRRSENFGQIYYGVVVSNWQWKGQVELTGLFMSQQGCGTALYLFGCPLRGSQIGIAGYLGGVLPRPLNKSTEAGGPIIWCDYLYFYRYDRFAERNLFYICEW